MDNINKQTSANKLNSSKLETKNNVDDSNNFAKEFNKHINSSSIDFLKLDNNINNTYSDITKVLNYIIDNNLNIKKINELKNYYENKNTNKSNNKVIESNKGYKNLLIQSTNNININYNKQNIIDTNKKKFANLIIEEIKDNNFEIKSFDIDLKLKNEIYEKEINLLKSLIFINNLHSNINNNNTIINNFNANDIDDNNNNNKILKKKDNYYCNFIEGQSKEVSKNNKLYLKISTFNYLIILITNLNQELKELKQSIQNQKEDFKEKMADSHKKVIEAFTQEVESRYRIKGKMKEIENLI